MPRTASTQPISPSLYRHFAVVTVFVTVSVAILADGSGSAAVEDAIEQREAQTEARRVEQEKLGERKIGALRDARKFQSGSGFGSDTRLPDDNVVDSAPAMEAYAPDQSTGVAASFAGALPPLAPPGLSAEVLRPEIASQTPRKRPTAEDRRRLEEQSRMRSGSED